MAKTSETIRSDDREKETKPSAKDHFSWTVLSSGTSSGDRTLGILRVALREKLTGKLDDEIKLAGLEALVLEDLEKHLILKSNRLRFFADARMEIVTYVEAKVGLRIRDSKPSDTGSRGHSDPMDVDAVDSLSSGEGKGSSSPRDGCCKCGGAHVQRDCNARKGTGKQSYGKGKQSKSWSTSEQSHSGKGKSKENKGKSKGKPKVTKAYTKAKYRKWVSQVLKTRNRKQAWTFRNLHRHTPLIFLGTMVGIVMNGMMTGIVLDGTQVGNKRMTLPQAHFCVEVWMSVPPPVRSGSNG